MKFEKITDTKIRVILDVIDIKTHNLSTQTIFADSNYPQEFLKSILITAEEKIGFKVDDSKLLVEAIMSSKQEFVFTITKLTEQDYINENISNFSAFKFNNFDDFIALCKFLNNLSDLNLNAFSKNFSLISYNNTYYLYNKNTENYFVLLDYMNTIFSEFGNKIIDSTYMKGCFNEYGKVIFENNAIVNTILHFV